MIDNSVLEKACLGDSDSFKEIIEYMKADLYRLCNKYYIENYDSDDLMQEMYIVLFKCARDYDERYGAGFRRYALICLERCLISKLRDSKQYKNLSNVECNYLYGNLYGEDITLMDVFVSDNFENPLDILVDKDIVGYIIRSAKNNLSDLEFKIFEQRFMLKRSYKSIAKSCDRDKKFVDNTIQRIRRKLQKICIEDVA